RVRVIVGVRVTVFVTVGLADALGVSVKVGAAGGVDVGVDVAASVCVAVGVDVVVTVAVVVGVGLCASAVHKPSAAERRRPVRAILDPKRYSAIAKPFPRIIVSSGGPRRPEAGEAVVDSGRLLSGHASGLQ